MSIKRNLIAAAMVGSMLAGCTIKHSGEGKNENVDIKTPMGSMSVRTDKDADPKATGITPYPGAVQTSDGEGEKNANVNMSFGGYGLKVAAVNYHSDDDPQKVMDFYKKDLARFGSVLVCDAKARKDAPNEDKDSDVLTCADGDGKHVHISGSGGADTELKVGTRHRQRIVDFKPKSSGTNFALVYVELRDGKTGSM
jgi:hypothetical protein